MTNEQRQIQIDRITREIDELNPNWKEFGIKILTKSFAIDEDQLLIEKQWNGICDRLSELNTQRRNLQTEYFVEYFNSEGILETAAVTLNWNVDINTKTQGWEAYRSNLDARRVLSDVFTQILGITGRPAINHIVSN